ncbi:Fibronectin type III domain protein [Chthoniobacter flavus Ellin428]|uniref:Fibronectin type III domain protein n=1 Tax=Chthoniobacter flavus Ellin428 TaxID=497964 RepID=B4D2H5_9BACT|nr:LamG-like jellyroll fold domain-containing protein [Chthoniobacter flavus]EDY19415.1 Fibronectin type III domain protein [Chthoniobacter flavus Ellin428]TCO90458.1 alginate lyase [Chthoniobacter flavus]
MTIDCPHCQGTIEADEALAGDVMSCPLCARALLLPELNPVSVGQSTAATVHSRTAAVRPVVQPRRATSPPVTGGDGRSGGKGIFWFVLLIAAAGCGYGFRAEWMPLVRKWVWRDQPVHVIHPDGTPLPVIAPPEAAPAPVMATPAPEAAAAPLVDAQKLAPDPLAWLLRNKDRWPEEVTLLKTTEFPAVVQGKVYGSVKVPVGTEVQLVELTPRTAGVVYNGGGARVPIDATNLLDFATVEMNRPESAAPVATATASMPAPISKGPTAAIAQHPVRKSGRFVHPGALHTKEDFERMAAKVKAHQQPWFEDWQLLEKSPHGLGAPIRPVPQIVRGINGQNNYTPSQKDAATLYQCALRYRITGEKAYANKAVELLNRWSATMKKPPTGNSNYALGAGIVGYEFACGAEMMRDYPGWKPADFAACQEMMKLFLQANRVFLQKHNGTPGTHYRLNWDTCNMASMLAIGVFLDDEETFNEALDYFYEGVSNGCVERAVGYVFADGLGQTEEMGRDQPHNITGWEFMAKFCQIAWNQGVDLFGYDNNRLLRGWEYVAKYNLGYEVSYVPHRTADLKYTEATVAKGSVLGPMWELVYNHYANRKGIAAPYVKEAAERVRPEPGPNPAGHPSGYDWLGFGTLTYTLDPLKEDAPPSGLRGFWGENEITLSWWGSAHADGYQIQRATQRGGPYTTIGTVGEKDTSFIDPNVTAGTTYYYVVASNGSSGWKGKTSAELEVANKLVTQYHFDGNTKDGVGHQDAVASGHPSYTLGMGNGKAIVLDGVHDYLTLPVGVANDQDITIAAWVYWDGEKNNERIFDFGGDVTKYMMLTPKAGDVMRFEITTSRGNEGTGRLEAPALKPRRWAHVAVTLSGDTGTLYVDGEAVSSAPITLHPFFTQTQCYIGKSQFPDPLFKGRIADFRIYNYALPASAVRDVFQRLR